MILTMVPWLTIIRKNNYGHGKRSMASNTRWTPQSGQRESSLPEYFFLLLANYQG